MRACYMLSALNKMTALGSDSFVDKLLLPGDILQLEVTSKITLGPGLCQDTKERVVAYKAGILRRRASVYWLDTKEKRYVPVKGDRVVGIITARSMQFRVDIGAHVTANLSEVAFEGATKRNRPNLQVGDLVFAAVEAVHKHTEPEITCITGSGKAEGLGPLKDGHVIHCDLATCRRILAPSSKLREQLEQHFKGFECAVGINGRIWVKSSNSRLTVAIANAIMDCSQLNDSQLTEHFKALTDNKFV